jgi:serine protease
MKPKHRHLLLAAAAIFATLSHFANAQINGFIDSSALIGNEARSTRSRTENASLNRIIIKFKNGGASQTASVQFSASGQARIQAMGAQARPQRADGSRGNPVSLSYLKTIHTNTHVAVTSAAMGETELASVAATLAQAPDVEYAEVDKIMYPQMTPDDGYFASSLWNMKAASSAVGGANFVTAWDLTASGTAVKGSGVVIAVLDTGYRPHADLVGNIVPGHDFVSASIDRDGTSGWDSDPLDPGDWSTASGCDLYSSWHGTHVAGIAAAIGNNAAGVIGGAYGAKILPVRALGICGGYSSDIAEGMYWAAGLHQVNGTTNPNIAKVINLSLGGTPGDPCSSTYQDAVTAVANAGSVVVAATGNDASTNAIASPANCTGVIAVTAHTSTGVRASTYANVGAGTTISAPGSGIYSTLNSGTTTPIPSPGGDTIEAYSGTSMATPHVAAAAALLYQVLPTITPAQVKNYLTSTARAFPSNSYCAGNSACGAGLLDAYAAVKKLQLDINSGTNSPPVLNNIAAQTATTTGTVQFTASASDADNDPVTFIISGMPTGASFNNGSGVFSWSNPSVGNYSVTITPTDGINSGSAQSVNITVTQAPSSGGGGGGGSVALFEILVLLCLALCTWGLRKPARAPRRPEQDS